MADQTMNLSMEQVFRGFEFDRLLNEGNILYCWLMTDPLTKTVVLLGKVKGQPAILALEKTAFDTATKNLSTIISKEEAPACYIIQRNDIYRWYLCSISHLHMGMKATVIYPATEVHIRKYQKQRRRMVRETPAIYEKYVEPYIETMRGERLQWYIVNLKGNCKGAQYPSTRSRERTNYI
jgi:m7GpppX diphosphatase